MIKILRIIYPGISGTSSGNGVNAIFTVGVAGGVVNTVEVTNSGKLYEIEDTITIDSYTKNRCVPAGS